MKVFISGGAKNGKSFFAQTRAKEIADAEDLPLHYLATMEPRDSEDRARIERHRREREGWGFTTVERERNISGLFGERPEISPRGVFLLDSVTALLSNEMFKEEEGKWTFDLDAPERVTREMQEFCKEADHIVFVSDYIYADASLIAAPRRSENAAAAGAPVSSATQGNSAAPDYSAEYAQGLALIDRTLAKICDEVYEAQAGEITKWK